jgi:magnesium chelatase subunit D
MGARQKARQRGRPVGVRAAPPGPGLRLSVVETLRAAAPWQRLRAGGDGLIKLRRDDFRVVRSEQRARSTTIFLVDASGSAALARLAEAKGAVELLLAECYRRRDQVALVAFRGRKAQMLLPPTRSLVRAKNSLAELPGGGGTPIAAGIDAGFAMAEAQRRAGFTPTLVVLTDGRANVTQAGLGGRSVAQAEAAQAARRVRLAGISALVLDISARPGPEAGALAEAMGALYVALPLANAQAVSGAVQAARAARAR